jgi:hypothetical protein
MAVLSAQRDADDTMVGTVLEVVTGGPSEIHFQRRSGDPLIHLAAGWLGRAAEKSARAAKYG